MEVVTELYTSALVTMAGQGKVAKYQIVLVLQTASIEVTVTVLLAHQYVRTAQRVGWDLHVMIHVSTVFNNLWIAVTVSVNPAGPA